MKAGLFALDGTQVAAASRPTPVHTHPEGFAVYDPEEMWQTALSAMEEALEKAGHPAVASIGITSMAEAGLLVDRTSGSPRSLFLPWYETCSVPQAERIEREADVYERFTKSGLHLSFKHGLPKLLWLKERDASSFDNAVWLSASGYIAYRLTGQFAFDYSLAARTYAFRIDTKEWDQPWIRHFGIDPAIFPEAHPAGATVGKVQTGIGRLQPGTPVGISGHDHVCAALSVGAIEPGVVYDSMGTAETLVGTFPERPLGRREYESGLSYGCHVAPGHYFWMGGNSASGGSVEWWRTQLGDEPVRYEELLRWLDEGNAQPSGMLYYPYLSGSGAPSPDARAKAALIGFTKQHSRRDLIQAVLEGTAYQLEAIRREAEAIGGFPIRRLLVVGGGTRNPHWLRIKADIVNCELLVPPVEEATMLGAALTSAAGAGVYGSIEEAGAAALRREAQLIQPDPERHAHYRKLYEEGYAALQPALREFYGKFA
ncbi:carbohydrate kinase [Xylanibacillus composti]|nr:carbohydrate kinase [Xylanibacillus composti]